MTRYQVSLLPLAEEEITEAFHWYSERSAFAADAFRAEVFAAIDSLADDPMMWPADAEGRAPLHPPAVSIHASLRGGGFGRHGAWDIPNRTAEPDWPTD